MIQAFLSYMKPRPWLTFIFSLLFHTGIYIPLRLYGIFPMAAAMIYIVFLFIIALLSLVVTDAKDKHASLYMIGVFFPHMITLGMGPIEGM